MTPTGINPTLTAQATLIYGATGTFKTTQVGYFSEYVASVTSGLITRVVSAESAGVEPLSPYIEIGAIEVLWLSRDMHPRSALRKIIRGEWPRMKNGIPERNAQGGLIWETNLPTNIGGYAFEGLTSFADLVGQDLKAKFASGQSVTGDKKEGSGMAGAGYTEEGETFGSGSQSQVGGTQDLIMELLRESPKNLYAKSQGRIVHVLFTAHESKGTDDLTGAATYGPGTIGKAITGKLFKECGTALHLETELSQGAATPNAQAPNAAAKPTTTGYRVWAYYRKHPDSENPMVKWEAKPRIPAIQEAHEMLEKRFPGGKFELTFTQTLADYLRFQDTTHDLAMKTLAERRAKLMAEINQNRGIQATPQPDLKMAAQTQAAPQVPTAAPKPVPGPQAPVAPTTTGTTKQ